ncbi:MFS transporter [Pendulispora albinea]|uniref:MFS transporter n=1 Tax=Pendulispora albinea TaxID=2741071 RepID=A0ABZ2LNS0_9BACT
MPAPSAERDRRWTALGFIALAQLMVALDATVVSIALPSVQRALHFSDAQRQWVITAYTLPFAGLLLLGGRIADSIGRKRAFLIGLTGFALASAAGGAAPDLATLALARAAQGAFAALLSPTALSLLAVTFTEPRERAKAFAIYGGIAGSGGAVGLVLGGALTFAGNWRWCLYVNVAIALVAIAGARRTLADMPGSGPLRADVPGVLLVTLGMVSAIYGCTRAVALGWGSATVLALLGAAVVLLALFVVQEARSATPLLPLHIVADRTRGGAALCAALAIVGMFGLFLLLTYYFQVVLHYSPLRAGLAFLPMTAASLFGSTALATRLLPHVQPRAIMAPGLLVAACGMALLTRIDADSRYLTDILPAEIAVGFGIGCTMITVFSVGTQRVAPREAGVASASINAAQQFGGSMGTALLNTIAASASAGYAATRAAEPRLAALVHGYATAAGWAAGILTVAAALAALLVTGRASSARQT